MLKNSSKYIQVFFLGIFTSLSAYAQDYSDNDKPNILFILVDDLGWKDLGVQGSDYYLTPEIDELARNGVRFTDAYAANPVCSPTRASIITGIDPAHEDVNITNWIGAQEYENRSKDKMIQPVIADNLALERTTIAESFSENGYSTYFIGKWHLGETEEFWPENQGFDKNIAGWSKGNPGSFFSPYSNPRLEDGPDGEYLPFRLGREANSLMEEHAKNQPEKPFFMYFSMYNVHTPIEAPEELTRLFEQRRKSLGLESEGEYEIDSGVKIRTNQSDATYAAMIWAMDSVVGKLKDKLSELGLEENTMIVFFSDNGGLSAPGYGVTSNKPLRGGKGWIYEGGIREPLFIKYPPLTDSKKGTTVGLPVISNDFFPTLLDVANIKYEEDQFSGRSIKNVLQGKSFSKRNLYWHYPHYSPQGGKPASAIRSGDWKLIHFYENDTYELYNLMSDPEEKTDLASLKLDLVNELKTELENYLNSIGASFPKAKE
ncbi:sulfatase [Christiangramia marina]|uniref:sulfatase n=1 Tax=Christiangramia marina TaxID=409436 RepID=UPI003AA956F2